MRLYGKIIHERRRVHYEIFDVKLSNIYVYAIKFFTIIFPLIIEAPRLEYKNWGQKHSFAEHRVLCKTRNIENKKKVGNFWGIWK